MYGLEINRELMLSNAKQLENQLRDTILSGKLSAGDRLPPTRTLAKDLEIARNTVVQVYEQLIAEGYLESLEGSGTYVTNIGKLPVPKTMPTNTKKNSVKERKDIISFNAGNPDTSSFPKSKWANMLKLACLDADDRSFACNNFAGHIELRKAICSYVYRVKGIKCDYEQIIITPGAAGGMGILAKILKEEGTKIAVEDPCIHFVRSIFQEHGYELCPIEVATQGMDINDLRRYTGVNIIYVVPSHQYPIGGVLPVARRIELLQYASSQNAYVIEDDYDSEYRYKGEVIQALRNLGPDRVIFVGSFSKIFSPSLRLGYMILPENLCDKVVQQMEFSNLCANNIEQLAMAEFINQRLLDKHIYHMKKLYEGKRIHLMKCLTAAFEERIKLSGEYAGLHLLVTFDRDLDDRNLQSMEQNGVEADFVEEYAILKGKHKNKLVLGYGELSYPQIEEGVRRLKEALL